MKIAQEDQHRGYAMEVLIREHYVALFCVNIGSLAMGLPLAWNTLWNLKERISKEFNEELDFLKIICCCCLFSNEDLLLACAI